MRVQENIEASGYFWLPSTPDRKVPGTLYITEGGKIGLGIVGLLDGKDDTVEGFYKAFNNNGNSIERIIGQVEKYNMVTLEKCFYTRKNFTELFGGIAKAIVFVHKAYLGVNFGEDNNIKFNTLQFSADNLDDWVGISGIKVSFHPEHKHSTITYNPPDTITHKLNNGMELQIAFSSKIPLSPLATEAKITQKA